MTPVRCPIFCALDTDDPAIAARWADAISPFDLGFKLGLEYFSAHGPAGVRHVRERHPNAPFFLDLKFHDIPNTVAQAVRAVDLLRPDYVNVHASGGFDMMRAARQATERKILAVTILTSIDTPALEQIGFSSDVSDQVIRLAVLAQKAGMNGVVCAGHDIERLRHECGPDFVLMVPGIRPHGTSAGDQKRVMTPREAIQLGATHLVIGRPITSAPDPAEAARAILDSLG